MVHSKPVSCLRKHKLTLIFPCQINVSGLMNCGPGSHPVGSLGGYRSKVIHKGQGNGDWYMGHTYRGESLVTKPWGTNIAQWKCEGPAERGLLAVKHKSLSGYKRGQ